MKDTELQFDCTCHVLYSKPCKKQILEKIALHYPEAEREAVWERVQRQYVEYLADWRTDLGGKKNFHNMAARSFAAASATVTTSLMTECTRSSSGTAQKPLAGAAIAVTSA